MLFYRLSKDYNLRDESLFIENHLEFLEVKYRVTKTKKNALEQNYKKLC